MSDMYFDTSEFDFTTLTDIVGLEPADAPERAERAVSNEYGGAVDDISDLVGDKKGTPTEPEDEPEEVEDEEIEEEVEEEPEVPAEPEEEEVDYEGYQITLPNGDDVALSELVKGYKANEELQSAIAEFQEAQNEFVEKSKDIGKLLELAKLEADRTIEDYNGFDWARYRTEDPAGYVENREYLDKFIERRKEIVSAMEARETAFAKEEASRKATAAAEAGQVLQRDIPGWNKALYEELMDFAVANGADKDAIMESTDPVMFKMLHKAMMFEKGSRP